MYVSCIGAVKAVRPSTSFVSSPFASAPSQQGRRTPGSPEPLTPRLWEPGYSSDKGVLNGWLGSAWSSFAATTAWIHSMGSGLEAGLTVNTEAERRCARSRRFQFSWLPRASPSSQLGQTLMRILHWMLCSSLGVFAERYCSER